MAVRALVIFREVSVSLGRDWYNCPNSVQYGLQIQPLRCGRSRSASRSPQLVNRWPRLRASAISRSAIMC